MENVICKLLRDDTTAYGASLSQFPYIFTHKHANTFCVFVCKYAGIIHMYNVAIYIIPFYTIGFKQHIIFCIIHSSLNMALQAFSQDINNFIELLFIKIAGIIFHHNYILICIYLNPFFKFILLPFLAIINRAGKVLFVHKFCPQFELFLKGSVRERKLPC